MIKINFKNKGFTLVEMLIAVSMFVVIATFATGSLVTIFDASKKTQSSKTIMDNLNFAIEDMTRTVRFGDHYYCGVSASLVGVNNCANGGNSISVTFKGNREVYSWDGVAGHPIKKSDDGGSNYADITPPEVKIQYMKFYVFNSIIGDNNQPYVIAVIKGYTGDKLTTQSSFTIQTVMSQRKLDI